MKEFHQMRGVSSPWNSCGSVTWVLLVLVTVSWNYILRLTKKVKIVCDSCAHKILAHKLVRVCVYPRIQSNSTAPGRQLILIIMHELH